jgi:hypothetical protein
VGAKRQERFNTIKITTNDPFAYNSLFGKNSHHRARKLTLYPPAVGEEI